MHQKIYFNIFISLIFSLNTLITTSKSCPSNFVEESANNQQINSDHTNLLIPKDDCTSYWEQNDLEDKRSQGKWIQNQTTFTHYDNSVDINIVEQSISSLGLDERPTSIGQTAYIKSPDDKIKFTNHNKTSNPIKVRDYGTSLAHISYIASNDDGYRETFTPALDKTYKASRNHPWNAFSYTIDGKTIDFDAGHGIDQADTIVANGRNSSIDHLNFVPQNRYYNQHIRNPIVQYILRKKGGSYKEVSVYDYDPKLLYTLSNKQKCYIPIGFIFTTFLNHKVSETFYFPNLISYEEVAQQQKFERFYQNFMSYFKVSEQPFSNELVEINNPDKQLKMKNKHSFKGYRLLSGQYELVSHMAIPNSAKSVLHRLLAIYNLEKAAHLEFRGVEEKEALVRTFLNKMKYYALDKNSEQQDKERTDAYVKAIEEENEKLPLPIKEKLGEEGLLGSYATFAILANPEKIYPEMLPKNISKKTNSYERGEDLYFPEKAREWLVRIEESVNNDPRIEDIIKLLYLYEEPEIRNLDKKKRLEAILDNQGENEQATLEEQKDIGEYFFYQLNQNERSEEKEQLLKQVEKWKNKIFKRINESRDVEEITNAAEWFHNNRSLLAGNLNKVKELYKKLLKYTSINDQELKRIAHCLDDVYELEEYIKNQNG